MLIWPGASIAPSEPPPSRGLFERNRGRGSVERNRDSRLLIALYSSWSMPASKAISSSSAKLFRFHGPLDAEILSFLRGNFIINRIQLCIRVFVFVFEKFPLDPKRTATARVVRSNDYLSAGAHPVEDWTPGRELYNAVCVLKDPSWEPRTVADFSWPLSGNIPA